MRHNKPNPSPDPPSPHRQTFPGLSDALDRLAEVAGYHPNFDELRARLNELADEQPSRGAENVGSPPAGGELVRAHHGSLSREQRLVIEVAQRKTNQERQDRPDKMVWFKRGQTR